MVYPLLKEKKMGDIMKFAIVTDSTSNILEYEKIGADAFIFALKDYSSGYANELTIDEIKEIKEKTKCNIFVAINKNIFNDELPLLEKYNIKGVNVNITISFEVNIVNIDISAYRAINNFICLDRTGNLCYNLYTSKGVYFCAFFEGG